MKLIVLAFFVFSFLTSVFAQDTHGPGNSSVATYCIGQAYKRPYHSSNSYSIRCGREKEDRYLGYAKDARNNLTKEGINFVTKVGNYDVYKIGEVEQRDVQVNIISRFVSKYEPIAIVDFLKGPSKKKDNVESLVLFTKKSRVEFEKEVHKVSDYKRVKEIIQEEDLEVLGVVNHVDPYKITSTNHAWELIILTPR
jgi:hypothetical protein